jgi:hypothetical protein
MTLDRFSWAVAVASILFALVVASQGAILITAGCFLLFAIIARMEDRVRDYLEDPALRAGRLRSAHRRARDNAALQRILHDISRRKPRSSLFCQLDVPKPAQNPRSPLQKTALAIAPGPPVR